MKSLWTQNIGWMFWYKRSLNIINIRHKTVSVVEAGPMALLVSLGSLYCRLITVNLGMCPQFHSIKCSVVIMFKWTGFLQLVVPLSAPIPFNRPSRDPEDDSLFPLVYKKEKWKRPACLHPSNLPHTSPPLFFYLSPLPSSFGLCLSFSVCAQVRPEGNR